MRWLIAAGVLVLSFPIGSLIAAIAKRLLGAPSRPEKLRKLAPVASRLAFTAAIAAGLIAALGVASPKDLKPLPGSLISFLPKAMVAILLILIGTTVADFASAAIGNMLIRATGQPQPQLQRTFRSAIVAAAVLLSVGQLGVNTRVVDLVVTALVFGVAAIIVALTVLGGREVATDIAAGRYVRRIVRVGDQIAIDGTVGVVRHLHAATVELDTGDMSRSVHVPHRRLLSDRLDVQKGPASPGA